MFCLFVFFGFVIFTFSWKKLSNGDTITQLSIYEKNGQQLTDYPLTFAHVFRKGSVFGGVTVYLDQTALSTQIDIKKLYPDGSIRHAVITSIVPLIEKDSHVLIELRVSKESTQTGMLKSEISEVYGIEGSKIDLSDISGSGHTGSLSADLKTSIDDTIKVQ